ncbi:hypothetical protein KC350_g45 [Hortaea werneckii]|nr:hypothetical protein KC350_g45 [Hortaea werneckii]
MKFTILSGLSRLLRKLRLPKPSPEEEPYSGTSVGEEQSRASPSQSDELPALVPAHPDLASDEIDEFGGAHADPVRDGAGEDKEQESR